LSETPTHPTAPPPGEIPAADPYYLDRDELPVRPRRRLLTAPTVGLLLVLFAACGFVGGVLVQKGQGSTPATVLGSTAASRFGATGAAGAGRGGFASRLGSLFGGSGGGPTAGTVTNIRGDKLYVTTAAGTMVEVVVPSSSKVTRSQSVGRKAIHPGDTVVVEGITSSDGTVTASTVTDSGASSAGGLGSLFGGGSAGSGANSSSSGSTSLFGGG